jgi:hypothetical protein
MFRLLLLLSATVMLVQTSEGMKHKQLNSTVLPLFLLPPSIRHFSLSLLPSLSFVPPSFSGFGHGHAPASAATVPDYGAKRAFLSLPFHFPFPSTPLSIAFLQLFPFTPPS